jgi:hypothetical protein
VALLLGIDDAHDGQHASGVIDKDLALLLALGLRDAGRDDAVELGDVELGLGVGALLLAAVVGL